MRRDRASSRSRPTCRCRAAARTCACGPSSACTRPTASRSRSAPRSRSRAAWARAPPRSSPACSPPTTCRARRRPARAGERARGPPRQRRRGAARRLRRLRRRRRRPLRPAHRARGARGRARASRCARSARARRCPPRCRSRDAVFNVATRRLLMLGPGQRRPRPRRARPARPPPPARRAHLFPRSAELAARARELGALGATISGAGPTVLVWCFYEQTGAVAEALQRRDRGLGAAAAGAVRGAGGLRGGDVVAVDQPQVRRRATPSPYASLGPVDMLSTGCHKSASRSQRLALSFGRP